MSAETRSTFEWNELDERSVNIIRGLAIDAVEKAQSGHPGMPMGTATMAYVLWTRYLRHNPADPHWPGRDRFVLSAGHGSMLLYSLLHLTGYDLSLDDLKQFRQWGSRTPGHPEYGHTPGVETTTGPLGQGFGNAAGMALAERWLAATYNTPEHQPIDHFTYVIAGDGDLMEGISSEAASLAGHLALGRLIVLYDSNRISIDGSTDLAFTEDVGARFAAYGWQVQHIDGNDPAEVNAALAAAHADADHPSLIVARTNIGFGSPNRVDTALAHGQPLGPTESKLAKAQLGLPIDQTFYVPDDVRAHMATARARGSVWQIEWQRGFEAFRAADAARAAALEGALRGDLPAGWTDAIPTFDPSKPMATRKASGTVLNALAKRVPLLVGGSADLSESNNTILNGVEAFAPGHYAGRNIHFGVREHAMGSMLNGMSVHGGLRPYGGTFLIFSDYMRPAIRLAALMKQPVVYVFTHDSIGQGEDGPTHQPVEQVMSLRLVPNLTVIRPADATETAVAWQLALEQKHGPTALVLTRQDVPTLDRAASSGYASAEGVRKGAYVLADASRSGNGSGPDVILIGTGSEVHPALAARELLAAEGIGVRVVSMPSMSLFEAQPESYRHQVLPPEVRAVLSVEAGVAHGWERYIGAEGESVSLDHFGASAPGKRLMTEFGFTGEHVAERARAVLRRLEGAGAASVG